jgi:endonuclease/exonuclease/phosphatase family metal-dependent hydrolase
MEINIISLNIWDLPLWFVRDRELRFERLISYIRTSGADIICLQESFDPLHRAKLKEIFNDEFHFSETHDQARRVLRLKQFDATGGLVILSKFPIVTSNFTPHNRFYNATVGEFLGRKGVLTATVETPPGLLEIVNLHLHEESLWWGDHSIRRYQLGRVAAHIDNCDTAAVLCGDFNEPLLMSKPVFDDTIGSRGFINPTTATLEPTYRKDNQYFNGMFNRPDVSKRFDYIFTRHLDKLRLHVSSYERELLQPELSDHDPVRLTLNDD